MNRRCFLRATGMAAASAALGVPGAAMVADRKADRMRVDYRQLGARNQNRSTVVARHGMACTSQPLASIAGIDILKGGGNAIDAAICADAMLSLVEPMSCGPGGDLFAILWVEKEGKLYGLNASGRSPYDWDLEAARDLGLESIPPYSPLSWSVPGCVSGWQALHQRFGRTAMEAILDAPIRYAKEGFPVSPIIALGWGIRGDKYPTLVETFAPDGPLRFGDIARNPELAACFEILLRDGLDVFYHGEIAERIVRFSKENGGRFSMRDFEDHQADWVEPVSTNYRGYDVWELPPNGQGIAVLQIMNMLEHFDIAGMEPNSAEQLHLFIEAKKLAYEDRAVYYADMEKADVPLEWLISKAYGAERARRINLKRAAEDVLPGQFKDKSDTIYLTTADGEGNMVSLIQSIYHGWGSHIVPDHLGFSMQNRGELFSLAPKHRNRLEPHKRPFHTIIPAFVTREGKPKFSFGVMGGDFQPQGHAQVLMNILDFEMSPQQAGEQPRIEHVGSSTPNNYYKQPVL